jgi:hypothetical protein
MIDLSLLNLGVSAVASFALKLYAQHRADKQENHKMQMQALTGIREERSTIREISGRFAVTRQVIVLSAVFILLIVPGLAWMWPDTVPIHVPFSDTSTTKTLWGIFTYQTVSNGYQTLTGIVYLEWHKQLMTSIIGLYLGSSIAERK